MIKPRVNGKDLGNFMSKDVIILGQIVKLNTSSNSLELLATDGTTINVNLPAPFDGIAEGYVEVYGNVKSRTTLSANNYIHFPPEMCADFENKKYSEFITVLNVIGDNKWKFSAEDSAYN